MSLRFLKKKMVNELKIKNKNDENPPEDLRIAIEKYGWNN